MLNVPLITNNGGCFEWKIDGETYDNMYNANVAERFESQIFEIARLKWKIICIPNHNGSFLIFVELVDINKWQQIVVCRRIQCLETISSHTVIDTYSDNESIKGWGTNELSLDEIKRLADKQITIKITIRIIQLKSIKNEANLLFHDNVCIKPKQTMLWKLSQKEITAFKQCSFGKTFENERDKDSLFILECHPRGINAECDGKMSLYLRLHTIPFYNANKMKIKYTLSICNGTGFKKTKSRIHTFAATAGFRKFCKFAKLFSETTDDKQTVTIKADIQIIEIYDEQNCVVPKQQWNEHKYEYVYDFASKLKTIENESQKPGDGNLCDEKKNVNECVRKRKIFGLESTKPKRRKLNETKSFKVMSARKHVKPTYMQQTLSYVCVHICTYLYTFCILFQTASKSKRISFKTPAKKKVKNVQNDEMIKRVVNCISSYFKTTRCSEMTKSELLVNVNQTTSEEVPINNQELAQILTFLHDTNRIFYLDPTIHRL